MLQAIGVERLVVGFIIRIGEHGSRVEPYWSGLAFQLGQKARATGKLAVPVRDPEAVPRGRGDGREFCSQPGNEACEFVAWVHDKLLLCDSSMSPESVLRLPAEEMDG